MMHLKTSFQNPDKEYSPFPFWFWNDVLTESEITRQIHDFQKKGVNGFVIHPRIGIPKEIEYLSDEFMKYVLCAVKEAKKLGMQVILYDEAMYPSGSAHGMVVKNNLEYASKALKVIEYPIKDSIEEKILLQQGEKIVSVQIVKKVSEKEIEPTSIEKLDHNNNIFKYPNGKDNTWSVLVFVETFSNGHIRGIHFGEDDNEPYAPASSDLLNEEAMKEFIHLTHERYYEVLKDYFGTTVIGIFTDEPCILGRGDMEGLIPWTNDFLNYFIIQGNNELDLPFLWFGEGELSKEKRKRYTAAVNKKMEESYYKPIYDWCSNHHIALTGHPHNSDDIGFLKYFHIPAQDLIFRWVAPENGLSIEGEHSTMAKCTSDSARHRGIRRNGNECFACCGKNNLEWTFTGEDMKWYMDWLFVRGVNMLFPHAFFYSVDGPRRLGERPPDVGPNNIWWPYYNQISDYIKRMSYLMTDCVNQAQVAVLCDAHHLPWRIVKPLYENQIEFNYLENELFLEDRCIIEKNSIKIANQSYNLLLIEDSSLIDEANQSKIQTFIDGGGCVLVYSKNKEILISNYIPIRKFEEVISYARQKVKDFTFITKQKDVRMTHIVKEGLHFYFLVNESENEIQTTATMKIVGEVEKWDALTGKIKKFDKVKKIESNEMELVVELKKKETLILSVNTKGILEVNKNENHHTRIQYFDINSQWYFGENLDKLKLIDELKPWEFFKQYKNFSGKLIYKTNLYLEKLDQGKSIILDLGDVYEIANVIINRREVGVKMWAPYTFEITEFIREGENELIIEVTNSVANHIYNMSILSGLVGPVSIKICDN